MATKQTLKSLLGGSDSREQVSLDLGTPALRPTAARGGQYNVAVAPTPKTNSALQLAQALRRTPQVLGQASNIAKEMGAQAASTTMDVEGAMDDKEAKGILGYDKAYQHGLMKRHFVMNEEAIKERFMGLARTDASLKQKPKEFIATMEGERQAFVNELLDEFGGNENREQAIAALTGSFVDNLRDEATAAWVDNKKDQAFMQLSADTSDIIKKQGITAGLKHARAEMNAWALDLKPSEKATKLRGIITAEAAVLLEQGKLSQAEALLNEAATYSLHGNAKLFGSAMGKKEISKLRIEIDNAILETEVTIDDEADVAEEAYDTVLNAYLSPSMSLDEKLLATKQFLIANGTPESEVEELVNSTFSETMTSRDMHDALRDLTTRRKLTPSSDKESTLMGRIQDNFTHTLEKETFIRVPAGTIGQKDADAYELVLRDFVRQNPEASPTSALFPKTVNGKVMDKSNPLIETAIANAQEEGKWLTDKQSLFKHFNSKTITAITATADAFNFGDDAIAAAGSFQAKLRSEAPDLWLQSGKDIEAFNKLLGARSTKIVEELQEEKQRTDYIGKRYKDYVNTLVGKEAITSRASKEAKGGMIFGKTYETLLPEAVDAASAVKNADWGTSPIFAKGITERAKISRIQNVNDRNILTKGSLVTYGFPTLESFDDGLMVSSNLSYADIPLGEEVMRSAHSASLAFAAEANGKATDEQLKLISDWEARGFKSSDELDSLIDAQFNYRKYLF